jgi:hypothetical protein
MAIFSLIIGGISFAFAVNPPTVALSPVAGSAITVLPNEVFSFTIIFTNTDVLTVHANDVYQTEVVPIPESKRNVEQESRIRYGDFIPGYDIIKTYTVTVRNLDEDEASESITYRTLPRI